MSANGRRRIEDMTLGELSEHVADSNKREDERFHRDHTALVKETTAKIMAIMQPTQTQRQIEPHQYIQQRYGHDECARCPHTRSHPAHTS